MYTKEHDHVCVATQRGLRQGRVDKSFSKVNTCKLDGDLAVKLKPST